MTTNVAQDAYRVAMSWATHLWRYRDPLIAGGIALGLTVELLASNDADPLRTVPLALLVGAALCFRRSQPIAAFLATWSALFGLSYLVPEFDNSSIAFVFAYFVSIFSLGAHARGREIWASVALMVLAIATFGVTDNDPFAPGDIVFATFFVGGPWATGLALRLRGDLAASSEQQRLAQEEETRRAVAEERATIARELHDVVSHAISVTVLQSRGARRMLGRDSAAVATALDAIEHTNTQALSDMRRLLAVLRDTEADGTGTSPQPSLARLDSLVADIRSSGLDVQVERRGDEADVPPGVDLSAYRIVQEALTNVLKHAGPAKARVLLDFGAEDLCVTVSDDGRGGSIDRSGHGLVGIHERVAVVGGQIEVGPAADGGFVVRARLPYSVEIS